ncbi:MAG: RNA methyltransferase [Nitrosomonas sp.]|jgi:TrmH family RNA methyltransferase|nr:RNA methyltransferase [Nitrosomonas sp.]
MLHITSREHPLVKQLAKLQKSARFRKQSKLAVLDGIHLIQSCLSAGNFPQTLAVSEIGQHHAEIAGLLENCSAQDKTQIIWMTDRVFQKISPVQSPIGILACIAIPDTACPDAPFYQNCCVLLESIQDPGNLGTILRSAASAGVSHVYLSTDCADAWSPKTLRAAMGAHFILKIYTDCNLTEIAALFQGQVIGTSPAAAKPLYQFDFTKPTAFVFGNEGAGLSDTIRQSVTDMTSIPMSGGVESLNAAIAASICLYEKVRQDYVRAVEKNSENPIGTKKQSSV